MSGDVASRLTDPAYLRFQYGDDERLRVRIATHERYSEKGVPFPTWVLRHVAAVPGQRLLDVGSGPGQYHPGLRGVQIVALDRSAGMLAKVAVPAVRADAQALPFADGSFDRAMALHVLQHVPDRLAALGELRRVVAAGGRVVVATNSRTSVRALFDLTDGIARELGVGEVGGVGLRFALEDSELVRSVFPDARVEIYDDAFRFPSAEPVLAYVGSMSTGLLPPDVRAELFRRLAARIDAIVRRDGVFRVPKRAGCFVADV